MTIDTIYLDLDDTIVDLTGALLRLFRKNPECKNSITEYNHTLYKVCGVEKKDFWNTVSKQGHEFWANLEITQRGEYLLNLCQSFEAIHKVRWQFLTALVSDRHPQCRDVSAAGKVSWAAKHGLSDRLTISTTKCIFAGRRKLLVDDCPQHVEQFRAAGGKAVYSPQPWNEGVWSKTTDEIVETVMWER